MSQALDLATQREHAMAIAAKYDHSHFKLQHEATSEELKAVLMYVANEANHKQRVIAGLDKADTVVDKQSE
ncbi:hypothetical protein [Lactiplantibacillus daowaiensis]|uniref:Uncharacterized protein n=1 Tax=Lactiplantibacillus daowaiensis TaxID=2559918 RepID=A0ABW1S3G1_9LACO